MAAFEAAARHENFARAAEELHLTHSAVSHAVRNLEARMGEMLFARRGRRVLLTPRGAQLAQRIRVGLNLMAEALGEAPPATEQARIVLGAPAEFTSLVLFADPKSRDLLGRCELRTDLSIEALRSGTADVVVVAGLDAWPGLASRRLRRDTVLPVAAPRLVGRAPQLGEHPMVENLAYPWRLWLSRLHQMEIAPTFSVVVGDGGLAIDAAKAGLGVSLARSSLVHEDLAAGKLVRVGSAELPADGDYHVVWDPNGARGLLAAAVVERLTGPSWLHAEPPATPNEAWTGRRPRATPASVEQSSFPRPI